MPPKRYWQAASAPARGPHRHVTVIGAGIVGLAAAAALVRSGREVHVIDAEPEVGQGTSLANGCQLSYGYVAPLAQPSLLPEVPELLFSRGAPLRIVPRMDPAQWRWMLRFLLACRGSVSRRNSLALLALGRESQAETELWLEDADREALAFSRHGKIVLLPTREAMAKAGAQLALQAGKGPLQVPLDAAATLRLEPSLLRFRERLAGAIHTASECAIDSLALCRDLEAQLRARGVRFELGVRVERFVRAGGRIARLETSAGSREVDALVLAAGPRSAALARRMGFDLPVYPLKGYSITARILDPEGVPRASITDAARKVVYARIGDRLRVAGVAEIRGYDTRIDPRRVDELVSHTREAFGPAVNLSDVQPWCGLRPATPTSVPIVGASPLSNVFLDVGQGALGLTLAFGSARRLAAAMDAAVSS